MEPGSLILDILWSFLKLAIHQNKIPAGISVTITVEQLNAL